MKLSEIKGEQALEVLADIIDPIGEIAIDKEIRGMIGAGKPKLLMIKHVLKKHPKEVIEIMARLNLQDVEEYKANMNLLTLPLEINEVLNDPDVMLLFQSQSQNLEPAFGSATESTEENEN